MDITHFFDVKQTRVSDDTTYALLSQKHSPKNETEFMDNKDAVERIDEWFRKGTGGLFVYGKPGCGKSCLVDLFCDKYKLNKFVQTSNNKRKKDILDLHRSVKNFTHNGVFIIDDIETSLQRSDNISMMDLANLISDSTIRIVFISQSLYINKMTHLVNACDVSVEIHYPSFNTLFERCLSIMQAENLEISETTKTNLKRVITNELCEARCVFNSLPLLSINPDKTSCRDRDLDLYLAYDVILNPETSITNKLNAFLMDTGTVPILFQENYIYFKNTPTEKLRMCESMSIADIIHKRLFNLTCKYAIEVYGIFATTFLNIIKPIKKPVFGLLWTKLSAMYQKRKYIRNVEEELCYGKLNPVFVCNMNDLYKNHFNKWAAKIKNKRKVDSSLQSDPNVIDFYAFMKYYNIYKNTSLNYDLINSINFNKGKDFTKKTYCSYMDHFYDLMDTFKE